MTGIQTIPAACPLCSGDVKGNDQYLYFCKPCNVLFRRVDLQPGLRGPPRGTPEAKPAAAPAEIRPTAPSAKDNESSAKPDLDEISRLFGA